MIFKYFQFTAITDFSNITMGIKGLTSFIEKRSKLCMDNYKLQNTELVIDGDSIAYQLYSLHFSPKNCCFGGDYDRYCHIIKLFFQNLSDCNVKPYIIFDGGYEDRKMSTILIRMKDRIKTAERVNPASHDIVFPLFLGETFKDIAIKLNLTVIRCDYEGDLISARVAKNLNCPVLSSDSDFYIFDVMYIPFTSLKFRPIQRTENDSEDSTTKKYIACDMYSTDKFLRTIRLQRNMLPLFAVLLGNDYVSRKDFFQLFKRFNNGRGHTRQNAQHDLIKSLASFLNKETEESAMDKILEICTNSRKNQLTELINTTIDGYIVDKEEPTEYIEYIKSSVSGLKPNIEIKDDTMKMYVTEKNVPSELFLIFIDNVRKCLYPSCFINILLQNTYHIRPLVEDTTLKNAHEVSVEIISAIHKILRQPISSEPLKFFARIGDSLGEQEIPFCSLSLPNLMEIQGMDVSQRQQIIFNVLSVNQSFVENCLSHFPESWKLFILTIKYLNDKSALNGSMIFSLLMCRIVVDFVDKKIGEFIRTLDIFYEKFKKDVCDILLNKVSKAEVDLKTNIQDAIESISYEDSLIALKNLITFFQVKPELKKRMINFNRALVHSSSQFQSCLYHLKYLNDALNLPFEPCITAECFNGTFVYNLSTEIQNKPEEQHVDFLLQNAQSILNCFNVMVDNLKQHTNLVF